MESKQLTIMSQVKDEFFKDAETSGEVIIFLITTLNPHT